MRFGWHWYDIIIVGLAAVLVYPDRARVWIGERAGKMLSRWHVVLLEVVAVAMMILAMSLLMPAYPRLQWWDPLLPVGMWSLFRGVTWFVRDLFGFRD
jgi:hypothetical protein